MPGQADHRAGASRHFRRATARLETAHAALLTGRLDPGDLAKRLDCTSPVLARNLSSLRLRGPVSGTCHPCGYALPSRRPAAATGSPQVTPILVTSYKQSSYSPKIPYGRINLPCVSYLPIT